MKTHPNLRPSPRTTALILAGSIAALLTCVSARAASQTWDGGSLVNGIWSTTTNWLGDPIAPGSTASTTNFDTATFNAPIANTWGDTALNPIVIDLNRNIRSITFTGAAGNYFIGSTGGNALLLSSGGTIQLTSLTATNAVETINAPLVIQGTNGTYTFANSSTTGTGAGAGTLNFGGGITGGAAGNTTLFLGGANDNANTISGIIGNGAATNLAVNLNNTGTWNLTGGNSYTGATTVSGGGTLTITGVNTAATGATTVSGAGGLLRLSGPAGILGSTVYNLTNGSFTVDNTTAAGGNNNARIADTATIALGGGTFSYLGANATATSSTETVGAISGGAANPSSSQSTITVTFGFANAATLTAASVTHAAGDRSILVNGVSLGRDTASTSAVARFISTVAPTLVGTTAATATGTNAASKNTQIVPFLVGAATATTGGVGTSSTTANTLVTYNATTGFRPLNPTDEFTQNAFTTGNNTRIALATTATATTTINSLVMGGADLTITDGRTVTDTSGALLFGVSSTIKPSSSTGALTFGPGAEGMVTVSQGVIAAISAVIADNGGTALTKSGTGSLTLTGANTYTGKTTVGGNLTINTLGNVAGGASALGNPGNAAAGTIDLAGNLIYAGAATSSNRVMNVLGGSTVTNSGSGLLTLTGGVTGANAGITFAGKANITETGVIATGTGGVTYSGTGTLTLTNAANSFIGLTTISSGTVSTNSIANSGVPSALGQGSIIILGNSNSTATTGKLQFTGASGGSSNRNIQLSYSQYALNGGIIENTVAGQTLTLSGTVSVSAFFTVGANLSSLEVTGVGNGVLGGVISNFTGSRTMIKSGSGTWTFSGANTYNGATVVNGGTLRAGVTSVANVSGAFGRNTAVSLADVAGAVLDLNGFNTQIGSLTGGGTIGGNVNLGGATLTVGGDNTSPAPYAGSIANGSVTKIGTGTLTLSGTNSYAGATNATAGRLNVTGTLASTVTVTGATLGGVGSTTGGLTTNAGSVIGLNSAGPAQAFTANAVDFAGATTVTFDAPPALGTNIHTVLSYGSLTNLANLSAPGYRGPSITDDTISKVFLTITTGIRTWNQAAPGNWDVLTSTNWAEGDQLFAQGDAVVFDDSATNGAVTLVGTLQPGSVTVNNSATAYILSGAGGVSGPTGLTKMNDGSLTLAGTNSYTGATAISAGTVNLTGSLTGGTAITVSGTGVLSESATGAISGAASLTHSSAGTSTLAGINTYTGPTAISTGTVNLTGSLTGGTAITVSGSGVLSQSTASVIGGGTSITFSGIGENTLAGLNTFTGGVTLNSGTLNINRASALGFLSGTFVINGGTIDNKSGAGIGQGSYPLTINGDFTFAGGTGTTHDINFGPGATTLGTAAGTTRTITTNAGTLALGGAIADGTTANGITKAGAGTLTFQSAANTFTGQLTVEAGTLSVSFVNDAGTAGSLGSSGLAVILGKTGGQTGTLRYTSGNSANTSKSFTMAAGGTGAFQVDSAASILTVSGAIGGDGALTKTGLGTLALTGTNSWSGATTIDAGTLQVGSGATSSIITSPGIFLNNNGTLSLFNVVGDGPVNRLGDSIGIVSTGGTLTYGNAASSGVTYAETVGTLTLTGGQSNVFLSSNMNGGAGNTQTLTLTGLAPTGTATATFSAPTTGPNATTNLIKVSGAAQTPAGQIIGPWAATGTSTTAQTDYAVYGAASNIVPAAIGATAENTWVAGSNVSLSGSSPLTGTRSLNSLRYTGVAGTLALAGNNLETLGILNGGTGSLTISSTGGVVRQRGTSPANLYVTGGAITISAPITNNTGALTLVKSGASTLALSGTNTFSGGVALNAGTLSLNSPTALGTGTLTLAAGTTLTNSPSFFNANNNAVTINGDFVFADTTANLGTGAISLGTTPGTTRTITTSASTGVLTLGGVISDGTTANSLTKAGLGTLVLTGANAYTGTTTVTAGTLILARANAYAGGTVITGAGSNVTARTAGALGSGNVSVGGNAALNYAASVDTQLSLAGTLGISGNTNTIIGGSIGSAPTSARIRVAGAASASGIVRVNVYGTSFSGGTGTYTLLQGGPGSTLDGATYALNLVYNNTNFTVGAPSATASAVTVPVTSATALTGAFWTGGVAGATQVWSASNGSTVSNWASDIGGTLSAVVPGAAADVTFSATPIVTAPSASTLGADMTIKSLTQNSTTAMVLNDDGYKLTIAPTVPTAGITLNATAAAVTLNSSVVLGSNQTWTNNFFNLLTVNGVVSGTGALTKAGAGSVVLSGSNSYTGNTDITDGTLQISGTGSLGTGDYAGDISISGADSTFRYSSAVDQTLSGVITGTFGALTKDTNPSKLTLSNTNTYTGQTTVSSGELRVTGSIATSILTLINGGTLSGTGTVGALTLQSGVLAPGTSPGTLNSGNLLLSGGIFAVEIASAVLADQVNVTGIAGLGANTALSLALLGGYDPVGGESWVLVNNDDTEDFTTDANRFTSGGAPIEDDTPFTVGGETYVLDYNGGTGNDVVLTVVPEPATAAFLLAGLPLLALRRRRRG